MKDQYDYDEPPIDPLADTNPSLTIRPVDVGEPTPMWRRTVGLASLLAAAGLTVATAFLLITPSSVPVGDPTLPADTSETWVTQIPTVEVLPTTEVQTVDNPTNVLPTISAESASTLLNAPLSPVSDGSSIEVVRNIYDPFTIIPDRPRNEVIQYTAVQGDTIYTIAQRFNLKAESIGWSNNRRYIEVLRPGDVVNIPPVDGIYIQIVGSKTIADYASLYKVDASTIIDSDYNHLFGTPPDTILPSGTWIFIPGGVGEDISWNPGVTVESSGARQGYVTQFSAGDPGSCSNVSNPGGGASWGDPLPGSTFVRGFSSIHSGVDLGCANRHTHSCCQQWRGHFLWLELLGLWLYSRVGTWPIPDPLWTHERHLRALRSARLCGTDYRCSRYER